MFTDCHVENCLTLEAPAHHSYEDVKPAAPAGCPLLAESFSSSFHSEGPSFAKLSLPPLPKCMIHVGVDGPLAQASIVEGIRWLAGILRCAGLRASSPPQRVFNLRSEGLWTSRCGPSCMRCRKLRIGSHRKLRTLSSENVSRPRHGKPATGRGRWHADCKS